MAAAKLGFSPVRAYDSDRLAVEATLLNARANGVSLDSVERFDLRFGVPAVAGVVAANLMRPLLLALTEAMRDGPEVVIAAGLLDHEADEVVAAYAPLVERRRLSSKGWTALQLERAR